MLTRPLIALILLCFLAPLSPFVLGKIAFQSYLLKSVQPLLLTYFIYIIVMFSFHSEIIGNNFIILIEKILFKIPIVKNVLNYKSTYRFCSTFFIMYSAGLNVFKILQTASKSTGLKCTEENWKKASSKLKSDSDLSEALKNFSFLSYDSITYISTGEKSGKIDLALKTLAIEANDNHLLAQKRLLRLIGFAIEAVTIYYLASQFL